MLRAVGLIGLATLAMSTSAYAIESLKPIVVKQAEPLFGTRVKPVRVRIGVEVQRFDSVLVTSEKGKASYKTVPTTRQVHTLRSRLEQKNHFYFGGLHVETTPISWDADTRDYKVQLDFYRTYGLHGELEEKMGSLVAAGQLKGEERILNFIGEGGAEFKDTRGLPIAAVKIILPHSSEPKMLSKSQGQSKETFQ